MSTRQGRLSASSAAIAAISSMRLLVVCASPPLSSFWWSPKASTAPQPPGPGLPEQAPSVWTTTCGSLMARDPAGKLARRRSRVDFAAAETCSSVDPVVTHAGHRLVEAELAVIFQRVLRPHQRARRHVEPVDQPRQQKAQGRAAGEQRQRLALVVGERPYRRVGLQQALALGHIVRMVGFEAPGIEADGDVVGERVGAGEVEIDQARELVAEEEHI